MPKYQPLVTRQAWHWHLDLEKAVAEGRMEKVPSEFTISGWGYRPISQSGKSRLLEKESECDETVD